MCQTLRNYDTFLHLKGATCSTHQTVKMLHKKSVGLHHVLMFMGISEYNNEQGDMGMEERGGDERSPSQVVSDT